MRVLQLDERDMGGEVDLSVLSHDRFGPAVAILAVLKG
jgi:hypothetical protein